MWPWMNQGFSPMYGMGGGFGSGWGGYQQYQPQAPSGADQGNARIDKLRNRVSEEHTSELQSDVCSSDTRLRSL